MKTVLLRSKNIAATEFYYDIIRDALHLCSDLLLDGFEGDPLPEDKEALVIAGSCMSFRRLWKQGYRNIVTWFQGALPEESFLRNGSRLRRMVLEHIEKTALKKSKMPIFVSEAMARHYREKYKLPLKNYYVMPCFNARFQEETVAQKDYSNCVFTYTGGLSQWQCIRQTLALYQRIEERSGGRAKLLLMTAQQEQAQKLLEEFGIQNGEVSFVHYTQLPQALSGVSFGFNLRRDNAVNRVATPTKLCNYVASGIIPIYTRCIGDFAQVSGDSPFQVVLEDADHITDAEVDKILSLMEYPPQDALEHFGKYFETYYNPQYHAKALAEKLRNLEISY